MRIFVSMVGVAISLLATPVARAQSEGDLRLVGGSSSNEGRVEVFHDGEWGTVCDDIWSPPNVDRPENAEVVCRQLGLGPPVAAPSSAFFGQGSGPIWMDDVACVGNESRLVDCPFPGFGTHNCIHAEDAGVICAAARTAAPALSTVSVIFSAITLIAAGALVLRRRAMAG